MLRVQEIYAVENAVFCIVVYGPYHHHTNHKFPVYPTRNVQTQLKSTVYDILKYPSMTYPHPYPSVTYPSICPYYSTTYPHPYYSTTYPSPLLLYHIPLTLTTLPHTPHPYYSTTYPSPLLLYHIPLTLTTLPHTPHPYYSTTYPSPLLLYHIPLTLLQSYDILLISL